MPTAEANAAWAALDDIRRRLVADIERLVRRLSASRGRLQSDAEALRVALDLRAEIAARMQQFQRDVTDVTERRAVQAGEKAAKKINLGKFSADDRRTIETIISGRMSDIASLVAGASDELRRAVRLATTGGGQIDDLITAVATRVDVTIAQARTVVDSAVLGAARAVTVDAVTAANEGGGQPIGLRLVGPLDAVTRPFCRTVMSRGILTLAAVRALDNGTSLPAEYYAGGYGCRHTWAPEETA